MFISQAQMTYDFAKKIMRKHRHPTGWVTVQFEDGDEDIPIQIAIAHLPVWEIYRKLKFPVCKRHFTHHTFRFSKDLFVSMLTNVYLELCIYNQHVSKDAFLWAAWECINNVDDFGTIELAEHHCSISLPDLVEIIKDPVVAEIVNVDLDPKYGTDIIEGRLSSANAKLCKVLDTPGALKNETLLPFQQASILNSNQIPQVMIAFGPRTEPNDVIIPRPVLGSSLSGMKDITDLSIEQQAARKSAIMNHEAIQTSQYWGRKMHLLVCVVGRIYEIDCGSRVTLIQTITTSNHRNYIGKFIEDDEGNFICLNPTNIKSYIDTKVNMRTVMGCKHTDGVCKYCSGLVAMNISPGMNLGINSAATLVSDVSQMILSTKHLIKTRSKIYQLPTNALDVFQRTISNGIHLQEVLRKQTEPWSFGIYHEDLTVNLGDLLELTSFENTPEERCSNIRSILIKMTNGEIFEIPLTVDEQSPFLTIEFLMYVRDKYTELVHDENVLWIPMQGIPKLPIFRTSIINDSMYAYVLSVIKFLESGMLAKHKDCTMALDHFAELVWSKVPSINILHLEVILRAHMVTSETNWDLPVVNNPQSVKFGKSINIIMNRTYSGAFALQGHRKMFGDPLTYVAPRSSGTFDDCFDLNQDYKFS